MARSRRARNPADPSQVLHPFYMFQIVSIILWSFDDYYYYAYELDTIRIISH